MPFDKFLETLAVPENTQVGIPGWAWVSGDDIPQYLRDFYVSPDIVAVQLGFSETPQDMSYVGILTNSIVVHGYVAFDFAGDPILITEQSRDEFGFFRFGARTDPSEGLNGGSVIVQLGNADDGAFGLTRMWVKEQSYVGTQGFLFIDRPEEFGGSDRMRTTVTASNNGVSKLTVSPTESVAVNNYTNLQGTSDFDIQKQYDQNETRLRVRMSMSGFNAGAGVNKVEYGVSIDGTDYQVDGFLFNQLNIHASFSGERYIDGLDQGLYNVQGRWRRGAGGAGTLSRDANDTLHIYVDEVSMPAVLAEP